jgi:hypothetical protein
MQDSMLWISVYVSRNVGMKKKHKIKKKSVRELRYFNCQWEIRIFSTNKLTAEYILESIAARRSRVAVLPFSIFERKDKTVTLLPLFLFSCVVYLTMLSWLHTM